MMGLPTVQCSGVQSNSSVEVHARVPLILFVRVKESKDYCSGWICEDGRRHLLSWLFLPPEDITGLRGLYLSSIFSLSIKEKHQRTETNQNWALRGILKLLSLNVSFIASFQLVLVRPIWLFSVCSLDYFLFAPNNYLIILNLSFRLLSFYPNSYK